MADDGRFRLELQSERGDAQIASDGKTLSVYDASSKTVYRVALPAEKRQAPEQRAGDARRRPQGPRPASRRRGRCPAPRRRPPPAADLHRPDRPEGRRRPARRRPARVGRRQRRAAARRRVRPGPVRPRARAQGHRRLLRRRSTTPTCASSIPSGVEAVDVDAPAGRRQARLARRTSPASTPCRSGSASSSPRRPKLAGLPRKEVQAGPLRRRGRRA